jgi:hypothetical protein
LLITAKLPRECLGLTWIITDAFALLSMVLSAVFFTFVARTRLATFCPRTYSFHIHRILLGRMHQLHLCVDWNLRVSHDSWQYCHCCFAQNCSSLYRSLQIWLITLGFCRFSLESAFSLLILPLFISSTTSPCFLLVEWYHLCIADCLFFVPLF